MSDFDNEIIARQKRELEDLCTLLTNANERLEKVEHKYDDCFEQLDVKSLAELVERYDLRIEAKNAKIAQLGDELQVANDQMKDLRRLVIDRDAEIARLKAIGEAMSKMADEEITRLKSDISGLENAPLCADHAQTWFTARNELHPKSGCVFCDLEAELTEAESKIRTLLTFLPDDMRYEYAWGECLSHEQDAVKEVRTEMETFLDRRKSIKIEVIKSEEPI